MKTIKISFLLFLLLGASCKDYLSIQPRDSVYEAEVFSNAQGAQQALNGIYQRLSSGALYGKYLSCHYVDLMAQYYGSQTKVADIINLSHLDSDIRPLQQEIWTEAYLTILDINNFCEQLGAVLPADVSEQHRDVLLGQAYAIRAMLHLDILRLFGPVPLLADPSKLTIPYADSVSFDAPPLLTFSQIVDHIAADLLLALDKLKQGKASESQMFGDARYRSRVNYHTTATLLARVYLYAGRKEAAWAVVENALKTVDVQFPSITEFTSSDLMFSSEVLFGLENRTMGNNHRQLFSSSLMSDVILAPIPSKLERVYPEPNDLRLLAWFASGVAGNKAFQVFNKFNEDGLGPGLQYFQSVVRKSEIYLIGAETAPNPATGYNLLNQLRISRNLQPLEQDGSLSMAIQEEYAREFWGEGQLFFCYKRLNLTTIPRPDALGNVTMSPTKYVLPLPEDELKYR